MCSWGCTYFFCGFLVGRALMKNTHLNEILAVNNWQLTFWILGESVLLCPSHNHYNFQVLPRGTPVAQEFFRHTTLLYMQCTGHTMRALSMNGFRRKFTTSALMTQCLDNQNSAVSAWSRLYSATHPRVKEPEKLSYKHSNFASSLMSELPFSACILLSTFNSPEVQSYRILRIPGMDIEWYWFCGDDISVITETKTQIRYLIQLFLSFFQVCKMLQWLL